MRSSEEFQRKEKIIVQNRKARHDFEILQVYEAGIVLQGTEVKSLRAGKANLQDAYAAFLEKNSNELYLLNLHIAPYEFGNRENHEAKRKRKLLLTFRELKKIRNAVSEKGLTLIPLSIFFSGSFVKVEIAVVKSKRKYDKREALKEQETKREIDRKFKY